MLKQGVSWDADGLLSPPAFSLCAEYWLVPAPYITASTSIWGRCWLSLEARTCRNALIISEREIHSDFAVFKHVTSMVLLAGGNDVYIIGSVLYVWEWMVDVTLSCLLAVCVMGDRIILSAWFLFPVLLVTLHTTNTTFYSLTLL